MKTIYQALTDFMKENGIAQNSLAESYGCAPSVIHQYMTGKTKNEKKKLSIGHEVTEQLIAAMERVLKLDTSQERIKLSTDLTNGWKFERKQL